MIQYMDQSNKNSSNDDFNVSKDGITLGDISYRESINEGVGISLDGNTPKHILMQYQQILVKNQIVNNAFKANDRRMPFAHFQPKVQFEAKISPKRVDKVSPKHDIVIVGTQSPSVNPSPPKNEL